MVIPAMRFTIAFGSVSVHLEVFPLFLLYFPGYIKKKNPEEIVGAGHGSEKCADLECNK